MGKIIITLTDDLEKKLREYVKEKYSPSLNGVSQPSPPITPNVD
ncbi:MAG: hypothetical protein QXG94_03730 [Candidatus Bathyarchaeia archaeon]